MLPLSHSISLSLLFIKMCNESMNNCKYIFHLHKFIHFNNCTIDMMLLCVTGPVTQQSYSPKQAQYVAQGLKVRTCGLGVKG